MGTDNLGILAGIIITLGSAAMIFGIFYLFSREKMAMIERGMDPRAHKAKPAPYRNLTWGLILIGAGIGILLAFILDNVVMHIKDDSSFFLYVALIGIFGGLGLFLSYRIEKKELDRQTVGKE